MNYEKIEKILTILNFTYEKKDTKILFKKNNTKILIDVRIVSKYKVLDIFDKNRYRFLERSDNDAYWVTKLFVEENDIYTYICNYFKKDLRKIKIEKMLKLK